MPQLSLNSRLATSSVWFLLAMFVCAVGQAQELSIEDPLNNLNPGGAKQKPVKFEARLIASSVGGDAKEATLEITAIIPKKSHIYSTSKHGGAETTIKVSRLSGLTALDDEFVADRAPEKFKELGLDGTPQESDVYEGKVTWSRKYQIKPGVDVADVLASGTVKFQACDDRECKRDTVPFDAKLSTNLPVNAEDVVAVAVDADKPPAEAAPAAKPAATKFDHMMGFGANKKIAASWKVSLQPRQAKPGSTVTLTIDARLEPGWHVYALDQGRLPGDFKSLPTVLQVKEFGDLQALDGAFKGPALVVKKNDADQTLSRYYEGKVTWKRQYQVPKDAQPGDVPVSGQVAYQMCNKSTCLPPTGFVFKGQLVVADSEVNEPVLLAVDGIKTPQAMEIIDQAKGENDNENKEVLKVENDETSHAATGLNAATSGGVVPFLITAVLAGFAALLTPCVFPMIPITVSFFLKQSEKQHHRPITMASAYCLGIMGTFTGLGMLVSIVWGAAALNQFSNNGWLNVGIGCVLVFFGLNLLGMFEIRVPSWLLTYTSGQESRGGILGVLFMALTFTLTSFTCTFAFAGLLLANAMNGGRFWPILGLLAFSAAFALPFFFLALFPSFLHKLPKSGGWMNVVKVIMGLIELGAAFKFFGVADLSWHPAAWIFDYQFVVTGWIVISITAGMYLLGMFRLPHDTPRDHIGVMRCVSAMSFFGLAVYMTVGLFAAEKPQGKLWATISVFATPKFDGGSDPTGPYLQHGPLKYALDFDRAMEFAAKENRPVFLDFTGVNCVNCREMEVGTMSQPAVVERLSKFVRIQIFTDRVPYITDKLLADRLLEENIKLQQGWFGNVSLPAYAIIPPNRKLLNDPKALLATFTGTGEPSQFSAFLDKGLNQWDALKTAHVNGPLVGKR